jgi:hypothetical protein
MPSVEQSGTVTADGTEQTLATVTANRNLMLIVDCSNMQSGDRVVVKSKRKVLSTSAAAEEFQRREIVGAQGAAIVMDPMPSPHQGVFTLEQTGGTNRSFEYSVEAL